MARQARVISIDALLTMQAALGRFERDLRAALDDLEMEVRRALQWIQQDAPQYWQQEVRQGWERVAEARVQLQQAMTMRRVAEHDPSCVEEKKALEKARRRLQLAQEKAEAVRHWRHSIEKAVNDYLAARGQLAGWLEADLPQARTALKHMLAALETYVAIETPTDAQALAAAGSSEGAQQLSHPPPQQPEASHSAGALSSVDSPGHEPAAGAEHSAGVLPAVDCPASEPAPGPEHDAAVLPGIDPQEQKAASNAQQTAAGQQRQEQLSAKDRPIEELSA